MSLSKKKSPKKPVFHSAEAALPEDAEQLVLRALDARATDIHIDPHDDEFQVRFRIDGLLHEYCRMTDDLAKKLISQLKVLAGLDIAAPFSPQEGRADPPASLEEYELRLTTTPVVGGEAVAVRLLHHDQFIRPLSTLGFSEEAMQRVEQLLHYGEGLVLVTGPTGSGKTTTLYSLLGALDDGHRNIVTLEDPVELSVPTFQQVEVDREHDVSMVEGLRTILRMDPDIVMLGEIRDREAADAAMRAASSGKYVFSTFHTRDVASVITALRDLQVDAKSLAGNLRALISQRLVRRVCQECSQQRDLEPHERELFAEHNVEPPQHVPQANGCDRCRHTGYYERTGIFEIAPNDADTSAAIAGDVPEDELRALLRSRNIASLSADALQKVAHGVTTLDEIQTMHWVSLKQQPSDDKA